ncbi:MAG: hypothetical protein JKY32_12410 [Rhizobiales bacterium]|nr:hypothetical protein [Hyphomicrobiales bacterium]
MSASDERRWADIRCGYVESGETVQGLCARYGISPSTLYSRARRENWPKRKQLKPVIESDNPESVGEVNYPEQAKLVARLYAALHQQMSAIERRMQVKPEINDTNATATAERDARTLSTLVRTLEKLIELQNSNKSVSDKADTIGAELDAARFRDEIVRRIEEIGK